MYNRPRKLPWLLFSISILACFQQNVSAQIFESKGHQTITHKHAIKREKLPFGRRVYRSIGLCAHALNYYGDLAPSPKKISTDLDFTRLGIGASYFIKKGPRLTFRAEILYGHIQGDDQSANPNDPHN